MAQRAFSWEDLDDVSLLVADVPWAQFLAALRETSGELFEVRGPVDDWLAFIRVQDPGATFRNWHLVGGELDGRSYIIGAITSLMVADRVTALAAHTGGLVVGYNYLDISADATVTVARGTDLLRYVLESNFGSHSEGTRLAGEGEETPQFPAQFTAILRAHGFDPDSWLDHGEKLAVAWTSLDREAQPEAHQRLYFGPLRMRVDHIAQVALAELGGDEEA